MNASEAYARLQRLGVPIVATTDAAEVLSQSVGAANKTLGRLAASSLVTPVARGVWALTREIDPWLVPEYLTAPLPSYVSLQTALHHHAMIEQIPAITYVVSLARTRRLQTRVGTFSIHRVAPELFGGFDVLASGAKMASPEKALVDLLYLSATRNRMFAALPELELPPRFDRRACAAWMARITSPTLAKAVEVRFAAAMARARTARSGRRATRR